MPISLQNTTILGIDDSSDIFSNGGPIALIIEGRHYLVLQSLSGSRLQQVASLLGDSDMSVDDILELLPNLDEQVYIQYINLLVSFAVDDA